MRRMFTATSVMLMAGISTCQWVSVQAVTVSEASALPAFQGGTCLSERPFAPGRGFCGRKGDDWLTPPQS